ncbi:MAG: L-2-amino-thiazoline-4-carboxylic acid hydrolase [Treponemataceae bacterium]
MHSYYKKNEKKLKKQTHNSLKFISNEIEKIFKKPYEQAIEEIWDCYWSKIVEKFPYIGGDSVSGTANLTGAYIFVAFGETAKKYELSLEEWGRLSTICFERYFDSKVKFIKKFMSFIIKRTKLINKALRKKDKKNSKNALKNPGSFETETQESTEEYPINFRNLVCPLYNFAKEYGYMDYIPYLCNFDYVMLGKLGISLYREKTCASGDDYCDFKIKRNAPPPSFWPPHILDKNDPLK